MHFQPLIKDSVNDLKHNYILAAPTLVASFISVFVTFIIWRQSPDTSASAFVGLVSSVVILYAHGVTLAMARELLETGSTSLATAIETGRKAFVSLFSLSLALTFLVLAGLAIFVAPGLAAAFFLVYALPSAVSEGAGPFQAIRRSFHLAMAHKHDTFVLLTVLVLSMLSLALASAMLTVIPLLGQLAVVLLTGAYGGVAALIVVRVHTELTSR
jgi:hypothetical protein